MNRRAYMPELDDDTVDIFNLAWDLPGKRYQQQRGRRAMLAPSRKITGLVA